MPGAVFGDFLAAGRAQLEAAAAVRADEVTLPSPVAQELSRLVAVMARYCDDLAPFDEVEASRRDDLHPWERAAIDAGAALRIAAGCVRRAAVQQAGDLVSGTVPQRARQLEAAATELAAGRDLLHTHLAVNPDGLIAERSEWASVVTSVPVTRAVADEIGQWSLRLAPFTAWLTGSAETSAHPGGPGQAVSAFVRTELATAAQWLQAAGTAVHVALDADPVRPADTELLRAIPAAMVPPRRRPATTAEPVGELCDGITISAARLRAAARHSKDRAWWSPAVTSGGWQWMAQAAAVTCHLSEQALRALATRAGQLPSPPASETQLRDAADIMAGMRAAWHHVDRQWDTIITETKMLPTQAMTDASDLVLRMGRLVWDDPHWAPGRSRRAPPRDPARLAPGTDAVVTVVAAVHQSVDALARAAQADMDAVEAADLAGRLYVPTRSLPEYRDVPRPFATAPVSRCLALHDAYRAALDAGIQAAQALDKLSITAGAPSKALALARAAAAAQARRRGSQPRLEDPAPGDPPLSGTPFTHSRAATGRPGPVEQAIRARRVTDSVTLMRAAAIDNAARQLILQAENATPAPPSPDTPPKIRHTVSDAAQLAAQSFPRDLTARPAAAQPPGPAVRAASSGSRSPRRTLLAVVIWSRAL
jgi:hypothetical protein